MKIAISTSTISSTSIDTSIAMLISNAPQNPLPDNDIVDVVACCFAGRKGSDQNASPVDELAHVVGIAAPPDGVRAARHGRSTRTCEGGSGCSRRDRR